MRCEVVLVRHAESVVPRAGGPDEFRRPLTAAGSARAGRLVGELALSGAVVVVSSPYLRARQTVEPLARAVGVGVRTDPALREWDSGLEPTPDYARHYAASWADPRFARPGGESLAQLTERATAALVALAGRHAGATVVVGSHGTFVARALVGFGVAGVDWEFSRAMPMPAVYRLRFTPAGVAVSGPLSR
ncbi:histidine phosphatase family protein [Actinokineospora sp. PR83]|uniref:histidine phosphatase family protein n=1 Tax=Actinokineospora sp. PR83 TaxID=2884908 RepID=UPI0027DFB933|nr:histidine phosphatase family protein [Actinokineospora sp. PR83]MCG8919119.1 histidine phosphatase family protein [Actinokineospora sp. PR83]